LRFDQVLGLAGRSSSIFMKVKQALLWKWVQPLESPELLKADAPLFREPPNTEGNGEPDHDHVHDQP